MKTKIVLALLIMLITTLQVNAQFIIENFDDKSLGFWSYKGGNSSTFNSNATLGGISNSIFCGYSERDQSNNYDIVLYTLTSTSLFTTTTVSALRNGILKFQMDLSTNAYAGITIKIKLQNTTLTSLANGLIGNSEYDALTTIGGPSNPYNWETLEFHSVTGVNTTLPNDKVNQIAIYFAFLTNSSDTFYFDNLQIVNSTSGVPTGISLFQESLQNKKIDVYPNPSNGTFNVKNLPIGSKVEVYNLYGMQVHSQIVNSSETGISTQLKAGIYQVKSNLGQSRLVIE